MLRTRNLTNPDFEVKGWIDERFESLIRNKKSGSNSQKQHWLEIGVEYLEFIEKPADSFRNSGQDARMLLAEKSGKSVETIHKIIDATTWVKTYYPHILKDPPKDFRMTLALKLKTLHRLDPSKARIFASSIFQGRIDRTQIDQVLADQRITSKPDTTNEDKLTSPEKWTAEEFQSIIEQSQGGAISSFDNLDTAVVTDGSGVFPPCDFLISPDEGPRVAVEAKSLKPQMRRNKIVSLAGLCALWQNQGYKVWVLASLNTDREKALLQEFADRSNLDPIQIVALNDLTFNESNDLME